MLLCSENVRTITLQALKAICCESLEVINFQSFLYSGLVVLGVGNNE